MRLLGIMDALRRNSFKLTSPNEQKKMMGLTLRQGTAIAQIKILTADCPQGVALKTLANHLQMTVPATSLLVEAMVGKGYFERTTNPDDRRAVCIRLSEKGSQLCEDVNAHVQQEVDRLASAVTEDELEVLNAITDKLQHALNPVRS